MSQERICISLRAPSTKSRAYALSSPQLNLIVANEDNLKGGLEAADAAARALPRHWRGDGQQRATLAAGATYFTSRQETFRR